MLLYFCFLLPGKKFPPCCAHIPSLTPSSPVRIKRKPCAEADHTSGHSAAASKWWRYCAVKVTSAPPALPHRPQPLFPTPSPLIGPAAGGGTVLIGRGRDGGSGGIWRRDGEPCSSLLLGHCYPPPPQPAAVRPSAYLPHTRVLCTCSLQDRGLEHSSSTVIVEQEEAFNNNCSPVKEENMPVKKKCFTLEHTRIVMSK
jgi:hypothetical protein